MRVARCQHFADDSIIPHYLYNVQAMAGKGRRVTASPLPFPTLKNRRTQAQTKCQNQRTQDPTVGV